MFKYLLLSFTFLSSLSFGKTDMFIPLSSKIFPDGKHLAFSWGGDIWKAPLHGGEAVRLIQHPAYDSRPHFSPDGNTLYFNSNRNGVYQIFKKNLTTGIVDQVTQFTEDTFLDDLSRDGKSLLTMGFRDFHESRPMRLFQVDLTTPSAETLLFNTSGKNGAYSPDGTKILFNRQGVGSYRKQYRGSQASQLWLYDRQSKRFSQPVQSDKGVRDALWKPDGKGFYYTSQEDGTFNLYSYDFTNGQSTQLTTFIDDGIIAPAISRDGKSITFQHLFHLYHLSTAPGSKPEKLHIYHQQSDLNDPFKDVTITKASDVGFSKSGLEIALIANHDLYVMDTVLKEPVPVTTSPERESMPAFGKDNKELFYLKDDGVRNSICKAQRTDETSFWWNSPSFTHETIFESESTIANYSISPDKQTLAVTTMDGLITFITTEGKTTGRIDSIWKPSYANWSPDSKWITFTTIDYDYNYDIHIAKADGSEPPINISQHPDNEFAPTWSPDGEKLAFLGRRNGSNYDIYVVDLFEEEQSPRAEKIEKAEEAMRKDKSYSTKKDSNKKEDKDKEDENAKEKGEEEEKNEDDKVEKKTEANEKKDKKEGQEKDKEEDKEDSEDEQPEREFFLKDIAKRMQHIEMPKQIKQLTWSSDSKNLLLIYSKEKGVYTLDLKTKKTKKLSEASGLIYRVEKGDKIFMTNNDVPSLSVANKVTDYKFKLQVKQHRDVYFKHTFHVVWRTLLNEFYDTRMNNRNWEKIRKKYVSAAEKSNNSFTFSRVISRMLGELNASHMGYTSVPWHTTYRRPKLVERVVHLGVRFDQDYQGRGFKVSEVFPNGPAAKKYSRIEEGEIISAIDGQAILSSTPLAEALKKTVGKEISLTVENSEGESREISLLPISYTEAQRLSKDAQLQKNEKLVSKLSNSKLGYINIAKMAWPEFEKFDRHIYEKGYGKDGLVIDVRGNTGGFTADHLLTVLSYPTHSITAARNSPTGYPQDRIVYSTWTKPIIVLCNQHSFSNAEIFTHAIKTLKRGKVVGIPTAGGVISTKSNNLRDMGTLRVPIRGWFTPDGTDMEMHGAAPDILIWPTPEEQINGVDTQLETAIEELLKDVKNAKPRFRKPIYKSQR